MMERPVIRVYDIKDHKLEMIGYINDTKSVIWQRKWSTYGNFEIHMTQPNDLLKKDRWVMLNDDPNKFGIIKKVVDDSDGRLWNSTQDFTVYGFEASYILNKRITFPDDDANKNHDGYLTWGKQAAEKIMYDLVDSQVINPADSKRKIEELTIKTHDTPSGHETAFKSRFKSITTDLQTLSEYSGLGFRVVPDFDTGKLVFEVLHGIDRKQEIDNIKDGVVDSSAINPNAYVFSQDNKRVKKHTYTHDGSAHKTMAYVAGEGDGADRKIVKLHDDLTGLERDEVLIDARDIQSSHTTTKVSDGTLSSDSSSETTTTSGDEQLTEQQMKDRGESKLETSYRDVINYEYESDVSDYRKYYDLGDTTTYIDRKHGIRLDQQITAAEETYETGVLNVSLTFGYTENTVSTQIESNTQATLVERTGISKEFDKIQANFISTSELFAKHAYIMGLDVDDATVKRLEADMADFKTLTAQRTSTQNLIANEASITALSAKKADIDELTADKANIEALTAQKADIDDLVAKKASVDYINANEASIKDIVAKKADIDNISANTADINELNTNYANLQKVTANKADVDLGNVTTGCAQTALVKDLEASQAAFGTALASLFTVGEIDASDIVVKNITADNITTGTLNGKVIGDKSVATSKLADKAVTVDKLGDSAVTTDKLKDASVTDAKLVSLTANKITTGTLDAGKVDVVNLNASNITAGTLDASKAGIKNLSADSITSGTLDASKVNVENLNASKITTGTLSVTDAISNAQTAANNAQAAADTTKTYFYNDSSGSHVRNQDSTSAGTRADIKSDGLHVIDQDDGKELASFTSSGAQIGKDTAIHSKYGSDGVEYYKASENAPFLTIEPNTYDSSENYAGAGLAVAPQTFMSNGAAYISRGDITFSAINEKTTTGNRISEIEIAAYVEEPSVGKNAYITIVSSNGADKASGEKTVEDTYINLVAEGIYANSFKIPRIVNGTKTLNFGSTGQSYQHLFTKSEVCSLLGVDSGTFDASKCTVIAENYETNGSWAVVLGTEYNGAGPWWSVLLNKSAKGSHTLSYCIIYTG